MRGGRGGGAAAREGRHSSLEWRGRGRRERRDGVGAAPRGDARTRPGTVRHQCAVVAAAALAARAAGERGGAGGGGLRGPAGAAQAQGAGAVVVRLCSARVHRRGAQGGPLQRVHAAPLARRDRRRRDEHRRRGAPGGGAVRRGDGRGARLPQPPAQPAPEGRARAGQQD
uniref:Uncharacterized protein n=1 Tax=Emiliania huxleyi (strain CCMP1516) TaxID=280463 RepID=A0A0D3IRF0_EMIH1